MVGAAGGSGGAELLGEVVADQRQVDLVDEAVADEGGEDAGAVLVEAEPVAFGGDQGGAAGLVGAEAGQGAGGEVPGAGEEGVEAQGEGAVVDAGMVTEEPFGGGGERRVPSYRSSPGQSSVAAASARSPGSVVSPLAVVAAVSQAVTSWWAAGRAPGPRAARSSS